MNDTDTASPMKAARLDKGWSQRQLAAVVTAAGCPVSDGNLSRIERGEVSPSPKLRRALADALGISATDLPSPKLRRARADALGISATDLP